MSTGSPYKILGIEPNASPEEIRKAYRVLVKKYHPDKNPSAAAAQKFLEIQAAYEQLLEGKQLTHSEEIEQRYRAAQDQYEQDLEAYKKQRASAREKLRQQKLREEAYKDAYLHKLKSGKNGLWHRVVAFSGLLLFCVIWLDFFLPRQSQKILSHSYGIHTYGSMDGHLVQLFKSTDGRAFWISDFSSQNIPKTQQLCALQTPWLKQVEALEFNDGLYLKSIPVHFSFYWAQIWVGLLFLIPILSWYFASADIIFVAGSFVSRYAICALIIYFLITENRFVHLVTFGQL
ncbi:MAG: J domain-containing protein [Flavobacteriales bacterium]